MASGKITWNSLAVETLALSGATAIGFDLGTFGCQQLHGLRERGTANHRDNDGSLQNIGSSGSPTPAQSPASCSRSRRQRGELDILDFQVGSVVTTTTPEPASLFVLGAGILGLIASRRRSAKV